MNYMLLIHQGDTTTPRDPEECARLSADAQQAAFRDYQAIINETAGMTPGCVRARRACVRARGPAAIARMS
jgi:hypothetical protein